MAFSKHRLGPPRSPGLSKGPNPLSKMRGKAPETVGSRLVKGQSSVNKQPRLLVQPAPELEVQRRLLAPPVKRVAPAETSAPARIKPVVVRAPAPVRAPKPAPLVVVVSPPPPVVEAVKEYEPKPLTNADRAATFGRFKFTATPTEGNPEKMKIDPGWFEANVVEVFVPALAGIQGVAKKSGLYFHKLVAPHFVKLVEAWEAAGLLPLILSWNGSFASRFRRGHAKDKLLSAHAWASAFDINARWNGLGVKPAEQGEEGSVVELARIAKKLGWIWGGDFSRPDGMHFEASKDLLLGIDHERRLAQTDTAETPHETHQEPGVGEIADDADTAGPQLFALAVISEPDPAETDVSGGKTDDDGSDGPGGLVA